MVSGHENEFTEKFLDGILQKIAEITNNKSMNAENVISELREVERKWISKAKKNEVLECYIRKCILEWQIHLSIKRNIKFSDALSLFEKANNLGFLDLSKETTLTIAVARFCLKNNREDLARDMLEHICRKVSQEPQFSERTDYQDFKKDIETLLSSI